MRFERLLLLVRTYCEWEPVSVKALRIGSRVMRRNYGSRLYRLVDAPMNDATRLDMMAATYEAIETWEPRLLLDSIAVEMPEPGGVVISLEGTYLPDGREITLDGIEVR